MWIDRQDLLYTIRSARRAPLLSIIAVVALSLGIGLNAGVFTLLNALFLSPPSQKDPSHFVQVYPKYEGWFTGAGQYSSFTTEDYEAVRAQAKTLEEVAAWDNKGAILEQAHDGHGIPMLLVTCNYFHVFGIDRPLMGRFLTPQECERGTTAQVALLSEPLWRSRFDANPRILGQTIHLNGVPYTVVGIVQASDTNPRAGGVFAPYTTEPLFDRPDARQLVNPDTPWLEIAGRLRPGYSRADAQAELTTIMRQQDRAYLEHKVTTFNRKTSVELTNGSFIETPAFRDTIAVLMALILGPLSLVLLLACSNVTMLFLSRAVVRRGEIAVRLALGIGRARLVRMLVLESFVTALIAGAVSIAMAYRVPQMIMNVASPRLAGLVPLMHPDWRVFGYLAALVALATIASSLAPAHAAWKLDLVTALKGREGAATMRSRITGGLIVAQIAMTFVLLTAAVLFGRMPGLVTAMDPGFETRQVLSVPVAIDTSPQNRTAALAFYRTLEAQLRSIPGVQSLAYETMQPFRQAPPSEIRVAQQQKGQGEPATIDVVSSDFFSTFGIRMMAGRSFVSSDARAGHTNPAAVVTQAFVRQFWPGEDPVGKVIITPDDKRLTVIGVAADTRSERFGTLDGPRAYILRDAGALDGQLYVRFAGSAATMEKTIFDAVKGLDRMQVMTPQTIWEGIESDAENVRSLAHIIVVMASIAVLLAITGVYGVLSFAINQRVREFGIRMVLGANRVSIFQSILVRGGRQIAVGLVCGVALAEPLVWTFAHLIKNSPFPFRSFDGSAFGIAATLLVSVSIAGMYLPALRATQVDPMKALRSE
jgi:putative ABC transport system permease protein